MEKAERACKAHCLVLPYPIQGHISPMLQFSKRLQHKGVKVTLVTTHFISKTMHNLSNSIALETISDGYDEGFVAKAESIQAYLERFCEVGSQTLTKLVERLNASACPVDCIIYDAFLPWVLEVAKKFGLVGAVFFTQSCAVDNIYYHIHQGLLKLPLTVSQVLVPELPPLAPSDLPSFIYDFGSFPALREMVVNQFSNIDTVDWVLCNTFYELEKEVVDWMERLLWPLRTIGPTIPSMYLDKRVEDDREYGFNLFKPDSHACMKWLNDRPKGSVAYVSFGSIAVLEVEQMEEIAWGLKGSNSYFLWVVRASEKDKLPKTFVEETTGKGLVVSWCPQLDVLAHEAVGCFVTHCGWNSTLEAVSLGVPMVAMPQWSDQATNAKYIKDVWKMGLKAQADEKGIVRQEAVEDCIREIMGEESGKEFKRNAEKWKKLAKEAMDEGGSSDKSIQEFVDKLALS